MDLHALEQRPDDDYLFGPGPAWFAFAMTIALMVFDYVDRQVIVSLFPYLRAEWNLSDTQLGALVSVVSVTVGLGALPVALFADRVSRVKSIVAMAAAWSLATLSCMWVRGYGPLLAARAVVGLGEAGYGSVGAALIASHFPARMRGALLAGFFASASIGSVLGVMLGGVIASRWGWQAAFGVVGVPGLLLALLYLKVRDYRTVEMTPSLDAKRQSLGEIAAPTLAFARCPPRGRSHLWNGRAALVVRHLVLVLSRSQTMLWVCIGGAAQLIVVSSLWSWLPSFLNRVHGVAPDKAGLQAALVVLAGAAGAVVCGAVVDRAGARRPRRKLAAMALLCIAAMAVLVLSFAGTWPAHAQFALIALGGFLATCTVGPVTAIVIDVIHPGVRATGASVLALFQNLFGLAAGPFLAGILSDSIGLQPALAAMPAFGLLAALAFMRAARSYEADKARAAEAPAAEVAAPRAALA